MKQILSRAIRKQARYVTLIEMMIVICLIGMIIGVVGYNYKGSLDRGKAFKSKAGITKLEAIIVMHLADHPADEANISEWKNWVTGSPLAKNPTELTYDGWGTEYTVAMNAGSLTITDSKGNTN